MRNLKLVETESSEVCSWCFARDDTVLCEPQTDTYWHRDCFDASTVSTQLVYELLYPHEKISR